MTPGIIGLSHIGLSVRDLAAARHFWLDVMGFELIDDQPAYSFVFDRGARLAVMLTDHHQKVTGPLDARHAGLDHLALAVPDVESLLSWEQRLDAHGVPQSPIVESDAGYHLNLRAPDNFAIELYVMKPEFAVLLGLQAGADPVAVTA